MTVHELELIITDMALSSNTSVPSVPICVEAPQEATVREVTLDGQEIYAQQLTMSDNLTRLAQRIDFGDQGILRHSYS